MEAKEDATTRRNKKNRRRLRRSKRRKRSWKTRTWQQVGRE